MVVNCSLWGAVFFHGNPYDKSLKGWHVLATLGDLDNLATPSTVKDSDTVFVVFKCHRAPFKNGINLADTWFFSQNDGFRFRVKLSNKLWPTLLFHFAHSRNNGQEAVACAFDSNREALEDTKVGQAGSLGATVIAAANFSITTRCRMEKVQRARLLGLRHDFRAIFIVVDIRNIWQWWNCLHWWRCSNWYRCLNWWWYILSWRCPHRWFGIADCKAAFISIVARKALARLARADERVICITTARLLSIGTGKLLWAHSVTWKGKWWFKGTLIARWRWCWSRNAHPKAIISKATVGGIINTNLTRGARNSMPTSTTWGRRGRGTDTRAVG